jgi:murein DD-endopeptidase MepM/ murein hydrolase activator NlpD
VLEHMYVFPVTPEAGASYGQTHHDYPATDIFAGCGSTFRAPTGGVVLEVEQEDRWDGAVDDPATRGGRFVSLLGDDHVRYYGSHLTSVADGVVPGLSVTAGTVLGAVGDSGNAAGTGCHLHLGLSPRCAGVADWWARRGVVPPWPYLDAWRAGQSRSPAAEVEAAEGAGACATP